MAKKFNLSNKSSSKTLGEKAKILENKSEFDFRQIPFDEIKVNNKNFYNVTAIEDLEKLYTAHINYNTGVPTPVEFIYYYVEKIKKEI